MVIRDNHPRKMSVSEILKYNTDQLVQYLTWELQIECGKCLNKILARTLAQIFIEEGIYKRIEKCKSKESMFTEVRKGLEKFKSEWLPVVQALHENIVNGPHIMPMKKEEVDRLEQLSRGIIPDPEIETLVNIPIRRISAFEVDENRQQIKMLEDTLHTAEKNLKRIKAYTIKYLQGLLDKYGKLFPRRTEVRPDGFEKIDMHKVALNNIHVGWDKSNCYIGTSVKSEETVLCNEFDHLLCIERKGAYKIIDIPEKIFIDRLYEFRKYDKNTVFAVIYSDTRTGKVYGKRTCIDKFIKDKDYRICPEHCRLELITPRPNAVYECRIDTPIKARQNQELNLSTLPERSPHAGGLLLFPRKLMKITFVRYLDENDSPETDSALLEVPVEAVSSTPEVPEQESQEVPSPAVPEMEEGKKKFAPRKKKGKAVPEEETASDGKKDPSAGNAADEDWGISQPELGF
jgi:topoisomerase-4 subunit A